MPQFLAFVGTAFASSIGIAAVSTGLAIGIGVAIVGFVTYAAINNPRSRLPGDGGSSIANQQLLVRSTTEPRKIVYGEANVSGPIVWMNTTTGDALGGSLYVAVALTGHEIDSFQGFYLDDQFVDISTVDTDANGSVDSGDDGSVDSGFYAPRDGTPVLYLRGHLGTAAQTVDTLLDSEFSEWTSNHRLRGVSYFVARMDRLEVAEEVWERGAPANISALIRGKKVYDPRLDSTFTGTWGTGSGSHRLNDSTTWEYSSNPALCLADYLIDSSLGAGWDSARINYNSVAIAADDCDDTVAIPTAATQARFTCNGALSCGDSHRENIEKILSSMAGTLRYYTGQWHISAGMWPASSSFALTESDLVDDISYQKQPDRGERFNVVRGVYFDPDRNHKESAYLHAEDTTLQANRDDDLELPRELDLPMTNNEYMAQRIAIRMLSQASRTGVLIFPMGYRGMDIVPGDRGTVTIEELGFNAKSFRCVGVRHIDMVGVELVLKEDDSTAYDDPAEGDYGTRTGATVVSFPRIRQDVSSTVGQLVADPFFSRSTQMYDDLVGGSNFLDYFWAKLVASSGAGGSVSISRTGGEAGSGLLLMTSNGASPSSSVRVTARSLPRPSNYAIAGEYVRVFIRFKRTTSAPSTAVPLATALTVRAGLGDESDIQGLGAEPAFQLSMADIAGFVTDEWQQYEFVQELGDIGRKGSVTDERSCIVRIRLESTTDPITLAFDACTVQRTERP